MALPGFNAGSSIHRSTEGYLIEGAGIAPAQLLVRPAHWRQPCMTNCMDGCCGIARLGCLISRRRRNWCLDNCHSRCH